MLIKTYLQIKSHDLPFFALFLTVMTLILTSCQTSKEPDILCPLIRIEKATSEATFFTPKSAKGLIDKEFSLKIVNYKGSCSYDDDNVMTLSLNVEFEAELGPAAKNREYSANYFIAIPEFYPKQEAKQLFPIKINFPKGYDRLTYRDEEINITLPIPPNKTAFDYTIYIGIQLDKAMLSYNRKHLN